MINPFTPHITVNPQPKLDRFRRFREIIVWPCLFLFAFSTLQAQAFTEVGAALGVDLDGRKDGGVSWVDFNMDGCLDLAVNTENNRTTHRSRLYMGSCGGAFVDVTATHATGFQNALTERSIVWADLNNDGFPDVAKNSHGRFEIYLNQGPTGSPAYSFGDINHNPDLVITTISGGMNTEGFGWIDYNEDGWLDLLMENHNFGIDIFENPANGTANFFHVTPNVNPRGLPTGGRTGDYMALTDYNNDGMVDVFARKENEMDIWTNNGIAAPTQFTSNTSFNTQANNGNKGGVLFADFDNDGDFDLFWGDFPDAEIFENTGFNSGVFAPTGEPAASAFGGAFPGGTNIDGVATGDVNHDGKIDLFLSDKRGTSFLLINTSPGPDRFSFSQNNMGIDVDEDGEGVVFGDYDNDGDLDLYVNVNNDDNQLWRNDLNNSHFLRVNVLREFPGGIIRPDIGATIVLKDCFGNVVSGIREVNGTRGHGSQDEAKIHFGLPDGPSLTYVVEVGFTQVNGVRETMKIAVQPDQLPNNELVLTQTDADDLSGCNLLLVEINNFTAITEQEGIQLDWQTLFELYTDRFVIERSTDGILFESVGETPAQGNSQSLMDYGHLDRYPVPGRNFYRLKELTTNGVEYVYDVVEVYWKGGPSLQLFPSLSQPGGSVWLKWPSAEQGTIHCELVNMNGQVIRHIEHAPVAGIWEYELSTEGLSSGLWFVRVRQNRTAATQKLLLQP